MPCLCLQINNNRNIGSSFAYTSRTQQVCLSCMWLQKPGMWVGFTGTWLDILEHYCFSVGIVNMSVVTQIIFSCIWCYRLEKKSFITAKYEEQVLHPKISNNIRFRIWRNGRLHAQYVALDAEVETEWEYTC